MVTVGGGCIVFTCSWRVANFGSPTFDSCAQLVGLQQLVRDLMNGRNKIPANAMLCYQRMSDGAAVFGPRDTVKKCVNHAQYYLKPELRLPVFQIPGSFPPPAVGGIGATQVSSHTIGYSIGAAEHGHSGGGCIVFTCSWRVANFGSHSLLHPQQPRAIKLNNVVDMVTISHETADDIRCGRPWLHPVSGAQPSLSELVQSKLTALQLFMRNANRGAGRGPAAPAAATDGTFVVHSIVDHRPASHSPGHYDYKVRWQGYGSDDDTWEPDDHLGTAAEKVASYNESRPNIWQGHEQRLLWAGLGFTSQFLVALKKLDLNCKGMEIKAEIDRLSLLNDGDQLPPGAKRRLAVSARARH
jgi:hypothetical protein